VEPTLHAGPGGGKPAGPGPRAMIAPVELTIVGAGAIGGILGAHLHRAGHGVRLVDADLAHVAAIRAHGLEVAGHAAFTAHVPAFGPDEAPPSISTLVLAVKTLHTVEALRPLVPRLAPDGFVVSMQNGLEEGRIAGLVGRERTVVAGLTFGGYYDRPGRLWYGGPGTLRVGEPDGRLTPRVQALARAFSDFHPTQATSEIQGFRWGKLILGVVYFATATVDADVVDLLDDPGALPALARLAAEALEIAEALGVAVQPVDGFDPRSLRGGATDTPEARATWDAHRAYWRRGQNRRTGIWRDLAIRHRPTEARPILGALLEAAGRAGHPAPGLYALLSLLGELEAGRPRDRAHLDRLLAATGA
jgi:2-dehydropantoate 2-reductase